MSQSTWKEYPLGEIVDLIIDHRGKTPKKISSDWVHQGIQVISAMNIKDSRLDRSASQNFIDEKTYKAWMKEELKANDVLLTSEAPLGEAAVFCEDEPIGLGQRLFAIRPNPEKLNYKYLFWCFHSEYFKRQIVSRSTGTTAKGIRQAELVKVQIPLPPIAQQKRIAAILDKADAVRRKRREAIRLTEELLRSTFLEMFGDPITNPKAWNFKELRSLIEYANNGLSRRRKELQNDGAIVLRLQDIREDKILLGNPNRIILSLEESERYLLEVNDLLVIRVNGNKDYVGRCSVFPGFSEPVYHNDHIIRIKLKPEVLPDYLSFILNSSEGKLMIQKFLKTSAGQFTISQKGLESVICPLPPVSHQSNFSMFKSRIVEIQNQQSIFLKQSEDLFNSLLQRAFTGNL